MDADYQIGPGTMWVDGQELTFAAARVVKVEVCEVCRERDAFKSDGTGRAVCERCATGTVAPIRRAGPKVGRNEPCHCGSGKKYKRCCR